MARKRGKASFSPGGTVEQFADDLGNVLSVAERRINEWLHQRGAVRTRLTELRDKATQLLERLGDTQGVPGRRRGRPAGSVNTPKPAGAARRGPGRPPATPRKKRTLSAAARKAISDAQKKRWAKQKKAKAAEA
jgi:hypothetical protein